jgi:hypothetical protein
MERVCLVPKLNLLFRVVRFIMVWGLRFAV